MDKNVELTLLYDIYGKLLTKKQKDIFEEYYLYNLSLREIAENRGITFQAVRYSIKKTEELFYSLESDIKALKLRKNYNLLCDKITKNQDNLNCVKAELLNIIREVEN